MRGNLLKVEQQLNTLALFIILRWTKTAKKLFGAIKPVELFKFFEVANIPMEDEATKSKPPRELSKGADYRLSLQAAAWDKQTLLKLLRGGESAWELELNGTKRTNDLGAPFCVSQVIRQSRTSVPGLSRVNGYEKLLNCVRKRVLRLILLHDQYRRLLTYFCVQRG